MTVSSATSKVQYNGNGSTTVFAYSFKVFNQNDLTVIVRSAAGTETVKTITTHYTVSGVGSAGGGNVTMLTAPASGETLTILREQDLTQELDLVENDPFPAQSLEDALDKLTFMVQQHSEEIDRSIKASRTNTISSTEFTVSASSRANKIFAFDSAGELAVTQELGTYRGNWATATAFAQRDIVKDTSNNNIYIVVTAHTSTGSQPISSNVDVAKWALLVDAASATTSASAAASSASAAATSETNAGNSASAASGSASAASISASNASTAQSAAEAARDATLAAYDSFDDRYLGAKSSNPSVDNDGNALAAGSLYFNTVANEMRLYTGSAWVAAYVSGVASGIGFTPVGAVAATNVQAAIQEVDAEKAPLASPAFTGQASFADGSAAAPSIAHTGDTNTGILFPSADTVAIATGGVERLRVNSLGKLNINNGTLGTQLEVNGSFAAGDSYIAKAASSTMFMRNLSGVNRIDSYDYPITANYPLQFLGSPLTFATADTERMRIDSSGNVLVGTTSTNPNPGVAILGTGAISVGNNAGASGYTYHYFQRSGSTIGSITQNGTTGVLYNLTSDYRLKNDQQPLTGAKEFVMALQPKKWQWWDGSGEGVGFIAHEFMEVAKYSGHGEKDAADADGKPLYQGIQPSSSEVMANLVSFIQEQQAIILALEARLTAANL